MPVSAHRRLFCCFTNLSAMASLSARCKILSNSIVRRHATNGQIAVEQLPKNTGGGGSRYLTSSISYPWDNCLACLMGGVASRRSACL